MPEERPYRTTQRQRASHSDNRSSSNGWKLIAVQSISCAIVLLIAFFMRMIGGDAFAQLRQSFNDAIMDNSIAATIASLFTDKDADDGDSSAPEDSQPPDDGSDASSPGETVSQAPAMGGQDIAVSEKKVLYAPEGATFAPLKSNMVAAPPLPDGKVTSYFGYRENPTQGGMGFHLGVDIGAEEGTPVAAMFYGVVTAAGQSSSYGNYVKIFHGNGMEVMYTHCQEILVQKDTVIRAGEIVARVGSTGDSTGNHLHVEVHVDGVAYDPADVLPMEKYD